MGTPPSGIGYERMESMLQLQRLVVSVLAVRGQFPKREILLQQRSKENDDTPYTGYLELPQGKVEAGESLIAAARRELIEEAGLRIAHVIYGDEQAMAAEDTSDLYVSQPFSCVADRIQNHFAVAVVVAVEGDAVPSAEATSHAWYGDAAVRDVLHQGLVFPLNRPMLKQYLGSHLPELR